MNYLKMFKSLLVTILFHQAVKATQGQCPAASLVHPCRCFSSGVETYLTCDSLAGHGSFEDLLSKTGEEDSFDHLEITRSDLVAFPSRYLTSKRVSSLRIAMSNMSSLFSADPDADNELSSVTLEGVTFETSLEWSQFENLKEVARIAMRDVAVPELDSEFRTAVSTMLKSIVMKRTNTTRLDDRVFSLMSDLIDVRIEQNQIRLLKRSMFPTTNHIETLLFNENEIETLPDDMFENMPNLLRVGLRQNSIHEISERVFRKAYRRLVALILEGNPINCDCSLKWFVSRDHHNKYVTGSCVQPLRIIEHDITELKEFQFIDCDY